MRQQIIAVGPRVLLVCSSSLVSDLLNICLQKRINLTLIDKMLVSLSIYLSIRLKISSLHVGVITYIVHKW